MTLKLQAFCDHFDVFVFKYFSYIPTEASIYLVCMALESLVNKCNEAISQKRHLLNE